MKGIRKRTVTVMQDGATFLRYDGRAINLLKGADDANALDNDGRLGRHAGDAEPRAAGNRAGDGRLCDGCNVAQLDRVYGQRTRIQFRAGLRAGRTLAALRP